MKIIHNNQTLVVQSNDYKETIKNFKKNEFVCPCCKEFKLDAYLLLKLELARAKANTPFKINSAFRCYNHNKRVGGVVSSAHTKGLAVDIKVTNTTRIPILTELLEVGFQRVGIYKNFIHVDLDETKPQSSWVG